MTDFLGSVLARLLLSSLNLKNYGELVLDDTRGLSRTHSAVDSFS